MDKIMDWFGSYYYRTHPGFMSYSAHSSPFCWTFPNHYKALALRPLLDLWIGTVVYILFFTATKPLTLPYGYLILTGTKTHSMPNSTNHCWQSQWSCRNGLGRHQDYGMALWPDGGEGAWDKYCCLFWRWERTQNTALETQLVTFTCVPATSRCIHPIWVPAIPTLSWVP